MPGGSGPPRAQPTEASASRMSASTCSHPAGRQVMAWRMAPTWRTCRRKWLGKPRLLEGAGFPTGEHDDRCQAQACSHWPRCSHFHVT